MRSVGIGILFVGLATSAPGWSQEASVTPSSMDRSLAPVKVEESTCVKRLDGTEEEKKQLLRFEMARFKEPFLLMFADGLTCREIAEATEVPLGTVLSRIHRARVFLRKKVRQLEGAEADVRQS